MRQIIHILRGIFAILEKIFEYLSMAMLAAMVIVVCYQVMLRYFFNRSPSWSEEVALLLLVWFGILSIPIGVKLHLHIGIEYLFNQFSKPAQWVISRIIYALIALFGVTMVISGLQLVDFTSMSTLPATKLPSSTMYGVIPLSGLMLVYNSLELLFMSYQDFLKEESIYEQPITS